MVKKLVLIFLFLWVFSLSYAQSVRDFSAIDKHAKNTHSKYTRSIEELARYLTKSSKDDTEKVRSIYVWIAENIAYDTKAFFSGTKSENAPKQVLENKKAVCQGYSELFEALCKEAGIPAYVIPGYSKGYGYFPGAKFTDENHAWNAVKVDGKWELLDVTWGAGTVDQKKTYKKQFNEIYFMPPKEIFLVDHLPLDPMWQLIECPISFETFHKSEFEIRKAAALESACIDPTNEINAFESLSESDKLIQTAIKAFEYNPSNFRIIGYAYLKKGFLLASENNQSITSFEEKLDKEKEILKNYEIALEYLRKSNSPSVKNLIINCNHNIAVSKNNIKIYSKSLEASK
jgi:hypothetical protein